MTPLQFEQQHQAQWQQLEQHLRNLREGKARERSAGADLINLYRRTCEHLAIARARAYPAHLTDRLHALTAEAHQVIYQTSDIGWQRLLRLFTRDFPRAVRAHARYVWLAAVVLMLPTLVLGVLVHARPELILSVMDADSVANFERMYDDSNTTIADRRGGSTDWAMFGYYIKNNIGVSFQCFASGLLAGVGSLFYLAFNGALGGAVAGYLTLRGMGSTFYSFVATHAAFELTAIVLSGAAGLRLGHALLVPGRKTRTQSLVDAARESIVIIYGVIAMLVIAAAIEAFWSSQRWMPLPMKYSVAALCWLAVMVYLTRQGREREARS
jgi:uncharacterized membrane protein SpoIIM required for sporulation